LGKQAGEEKKEEGEASLPSLAMKEASGLPREDGRKKRLVTC